MLVSFTISNFRSFGQAERFSMEAGRTRSFADRTVRSANAKILKFKAIYGANASGKSNLVKAIDFMQHAIIYGIPADSVSDYCRMQDTNIDRPSIFEVEVILEGIRYIYGFEVLLNSGVFIREWLNEKKGQKSRIIFLRDIQSGTYDVESYTNDNALNERLRIYADDIKKDGSILFLRTMNQNKDSLYVSNSKIKVYRAMYRWFRYKLSVNYPDEPITQFTYFFDSQGSENAEKLLARLDTGISKVLVYDEPADKVMSQFPKVFCQEVLDNLNEQKRRIDEKGLKESPAIMIRSHEGHSMYIIELNGEDVICKTLKFNHKHSSSLFALNEESDGTIRLLDLLEVLLSNTPGMVYVIDEVSRCLHPLLTKKFVSNFLDLAVERNIQLIVSTHEADLMDLDLLRQDEIGFVGKREEDGTSKIFGLEEFGARFDKRIRKAYLEGQYGAIPKI
ncbi:MAG: AAA family ATPase [Hydrogeniiclostridium mannosilyticum]